MRVLAALALVPAVLAVLAGGTATAADVVATGVSFSGAGGGTRFVVEMSRAPVARTFVVDEPPRLVIDLEDVLFDLPKTVHPTGLVTAFRYGPLDPRTGRMVLDLAGPALIERSFFLPPLAGRPGRLVVDLEAAGKSAFEGAAARATAVAAAAENSGLPAVASAGPVVVLDPGHGGIDPGAGTATGLREKEIVLAFALRLKAELETIPGITVKLTRTDDTFLSLNRRIKVARAYGADLFISLHADAAPQDYVHGATIYSLSERASDAEAAAIAARENLSDAVSGAIEPQLQEDVSGILADLLRRETKAMSYDFAERGIAALAPSVRMNGHPHRTGRFLVLMAHDIPSVLVELGYLTNEGDVLDLLDEEWQRRTAAALAHAVAGYFEVQTVAGEGDAATAR